VLFARGYLGHRHISLPGFMIDMPEAQLRDLFVSAVLDVEQRGAVWARIEQAEQIRRASNVYLEMSFWRRAFDDGAAREGDFVIDALGTNGETYASCLEVLGQGRLSSTRLGAVRTRMLARERILDSKRGLVDQRLLDALAHDRDSYQLGYDTELQREPGGEDVAPLEALYDQVLLTRAPGPGALDWSFASEALGRLAVRIDRERKRCETLASLAERRLAQLAGDAAYVVAGIDRDGLSSVWIAPVPGLDASLFEPDLARRFVEAATSDVTTPAQRTRALERFVVARNYGRLYRRLEAIEYRCDLARYQHGRAMSVATLQRAGINADWLSDGAGAREFERVLVGDHPDEVYGALHALLDERCGEQVARQVGIARYNVISTQRARDYLDGYLARTPSPGLIDPSRSAYDTLFRSGELSDREMGSLAARIDDQDREALLGGVRAIADRFGQVFGRIGDPTSIDFIPSVVLPPMLGGVMRGSCYPLSLVTALALVQGRASVNAWFGRLAAIYQLLESPHGEGLLHGVPEAADALALNPERIEHVAETIGVLSRLQLAQPAISTWLMGDQLTIEPQLRAPAWLDSLRVRGPGVWIVGPPDHALVLAIEPAADLARYMLFEPNYGLLGFDHIDHFCAFMARAIEVEYGARLGNPFDGIFDSWHIDTMSLAVLPMSDEATDARTLTDFIAGVRAPERPAAP
jgi:hypothetical protein